MTVGFQQTPDLDRLRRVLEREGMGAAVIQRFGKASGQPGHHQDRRPPARVEEGSRDRIVAALNHEFNPGQQAGLDLNQIGADALGALLQANDPDHVGAEPATAPAHYGAQADAILKARHDKGAVQVARRARRHSGRDPGVGRPR